MAQDEVQVLEAVLAAEAERLAAAESLFIDTAIRAEFASPAAADEWAARFQAHMRRVPVPLLVSYAQANTASGQLARIPRRLDGHAVIDARVAPRASATSPSRTVVRLSRAGFTGGRDSAMVFVHRHCGPLCGSMDFVLIVRSPDTQAWYFRRSLWSALS